MSVIRVSNEHSSPELPSSPELTVARRAAQAAAEIITGYYRDGFSVHTKENVAATYNLVTDADLAAEKAIVEIIRETYPDHAFIAEETHQADAARWYKAPFLMRPPKADPHGAPRVLHYEASRPARSRKYSCSLAI